MKTSLSLHCRIMTALLLSIVFLVLISCRSDDPELLSSDKAITSFSFLAIDNPTLSSDVPGIIAGEEITCAFPAGVVVTGLKPTIIHTGSSLNPVSGSANNFTSPVTYTVLAEDGTSREYTVSVSVAAADPVVYVAGTQFIHGTSHITVWKDGTPAKLTNGAYNAYCESAFVSGNTVYVAGYQSIGHYWATYWTENETGPGAVELNETINDAYANSIYVSDNNDVYAAGVENHGAEIGFIAKVWKNGVATALTTKSGAAFSVFVSGNDVYVAGFEETTAGWNAKVWKNGVATTLSTEDEKAYARCVFVSGSDVYVAGEYWNGSAYVIKVWKNGTAQIITPDTQGAEVSSIFVSDGNVYLAGREINDNQWNAKVWVNGAGTFLSLVPHSDARSVYVHNDDVYVAGWVPDNDGKNAAILWKNGTATVLAKDALATETYAMSVMVK